MKKRELDLDLDMFDWKQVYEVHEVKFYLKKSGLTSTLRIEAPGYHEQEYDADWAFESAGLLYLSQYRNDLKKQVVKVLTWLIDNAHFPYPVEELC